MTWTIYGTPLRPGYCEVHPDVPCPYPCPECRRDAEYFDARRREEEALYHEAMQKVDDHDHEWATLDCPTCEGTGEIQWNPSTTGDPACVEDDRCPDCFGTGVAEADPTQNSWRDLGVHGTYGSPDDPAATRERSAA